MEFELLKELNEAKELNYLKPDGTPYTEDDFNKALDSFIAGAQKIVDATYGTDWQARALGMDKGPKYIRVWSALKKTMDQKNAWVFIDKSTGTILKPAGWKSPAKGSRGNIFDANNGLKSVSAYGANYLR